MKRLVLLFLVGAVILGWGAAVASIPADVQTLIDKMNSGVQLTSDEKAIVSYYYDSQPSGPSQGPGGIDAPAVATIPYAWVEIAGTAGGSGTSTGITGDDTNGGPFTIGFTYPFFGWGSFSTIRVCTNGFASFTSTANTYANSCLPYAGEPYNLVAPFWDDFNTTPGTSSIWYYNDVANNRFIIEWYHNQLWVSSGVFTGSLTYEAILYSNGNIDFMYNTMDPGTMALTSGTVGVQNSTGTYATQYLCNAVGITSNMGLRFSPPLPGIYLNSPTVTPASGTTSTTFAYSVAYMNPSNTAPTLKQVYIDGNPFTMTDPGGLYSEGVTMTYSTTLAVGAHNYAYLFATATDTSRSPTSGTWTGPTVYPAMTGDYDVGGGNNDFATPVAAAAALGVAGVGGPVTFNIYNGTYDGQINLPAITGVGPGATVTFRNATGQNPVITSTSGYGFYLTGADYVTIQGLTITNCYYHGIYNYFGADSSTNNTFRGNYIYNVGTAGDYAGICLYIGADCQVLGNRIDGDYYGINVQYSDRNLIANNMIYNTGYFGIYSYSGSYDNYYYNTVYTTTSYAFYESYGNYVNVKNNIFYQAGTGSLYAYVLYGDPPSYSMTSDNNDLYAPNAYVGYYNGTYCANLAEWRTATGVDAASISANPVFVNAPTDMHIKTYLPSPVDGLGTPVATVTTDYDNEVRNGTTPDIGADEFTYAPLGYCLEMTPVTAASTAGPNISTDYTFTIWNCGTVSDVYNLSAMVTAGEAWTHQVMNNTGSAVIDSLAVAASGTGTFRVRVTPGAGASAPQSSTGRIMALSRHGSFRSILSDTSWTTTTCSMGGTIDVGGGAMHYATPVAAAQAMVTYGIYAAVTFNIYNGTYNGEIDLPGTIPGMGSGNPITFQNATGQSPVITSTTGYGFYLTGADYITIQGLTITNCYYDGIYNYFTGTDSSKNNTFRGNYIYNVGTAGSYAGINLYKAADCQVLGNRISGDYYGINVQMANRNLVLGNRIDGSYYGIYVQSADRNLIANNMISNTGYIGIFSNGSNYDDYYYNAVYTTTNTAFWEGYGYYVNVKNNIFYQAGTGALYAYYLTTAPATYFMTSNNNDLYAPNAYVGYYGAAYQTLAAWRTATGVDAASVSGNPVFVDAVTGDLHIKTYFASPVDGMATPLATVTTDYDNEVRNGSTPDIGADEYTYLPLAYCLELTPPTAAGSAAPSISTDYTFTIWNCGSVSDVYNLSAVVTTGQTWTHQVMNNTGSAVIDSLAVASGGSGTFRVRVTPGGGALPYQTSTGRIMALSRHGSFRNILSDTSWTTTTCLMGGTYDVGGGAMHYATPVAAATALATYGVGAPVIFNIYNGTYDGQVNLPPITGVSATNTVTFRPAPGNNPVITSTSGYGFYFTGADYITIRNLRITNCYYDGIVLYGSYADSSTFDRIIGNHIYNVGTAGSYYGIYMYYAADCQILQNEIQGDYIGIYLSYSNRNTIANNMIYNVGYIGIYSSYSNSNSYYYNSILSPATASYTFYMAYSSNTTVKDNIFYQLGTGYAYYFYPDFASYPLVSNYNDLYAPSSTALGYYNGTYCADLAAWRAATGQDANSISANPLFQSLTDTPNLHITVTQLSPVDGAGTPIPAISNDFDGDTRDVAIPDIGADEFSGYFVELTPPTAAGGAGPGLSYNYNFTVWNRGWSSDVYSLSAVASSGETWTHQVMNNTGSMVIDSLAVAGGGTGTFMVRVTVGAGGFPGQTSTGRIMAVSRRGSASDTSWTTTTSMVGGTYDVGGGAMHFATPVAAATALVTYGVGAPTVFNIYTGTYDGQVNLPAITGVSATNTVTFQAAPGNIPVITSTTGSGFYLSGADYITIRNLEIANCYRHGIYNYYSGSDSSNFNSFIKNYIHNVGTSGNYAGIHLYNSASCQVLQNKIDGDYYGIYLNTSHRNTISNNMIYNTGYYGICNSSSNSNNYYYNSVLNLSTANFTFFMGSSTNTTVKDNIFYQQGTGARYAYYVLGTIGISNYNDLYAPSATYLGKYNTTNCANLAAWRTATGQDANSISANPSYMSISAPYNLHVNLPSPVDSAGIPIAGITNDFDGNLRNSAHPDIGADEVGVASPPGVVDDLIITLSGFTDDRTNITLSWSPALNAQQYHIYKSTTSPESGFVLIGSTTDNTYTDSNAIVGQIKSFYYVTADNESLDLPGTGIQPSTGIGIPAEESSFSGRYSAP